MKKYRVRIPYFCTVLVEVEAENEEEAKDAAVSEVYPSLCHECSNTVEMDEMNDDAEISVEEA
jgi:hypothetical protein